jgi:hypothetical protein
VLVRAEGDDFSAVADVEVFIGIDESQAAELEATVVAVIGAIEGLPVPTIALVHGRCYAGALEVSLACDLIWAAEGSQIGQIEAVAGGIPYAGGTQRLASRIGAGRAAEMVFTAAVLPPETFALHRRHEGKPLDCVCPLHCGDAAGSLFEGTWPVWTPARVGGHVPSGTGMSNVFSIPQTVW